MRERSVEGGEERCVSLMPARVETRPLLEQTLTKPPPIRSALNCSLVDIAR